MNAADLDYLVGRLAGHRMIGHVPREQLEWLAAHGVLQKFDVGDVMTKRNEPPLGVYIVLSGLVSISVDHGAGPKKVREWPAGDITGVLPYSRMTAAPGDALIEQPTEALLIATGLLGDMIRECYDVTAVMVHEMLDRARVFSASQFQDERLMSLGRVAAGLAHELNNPASAVARSAKTLLSELDDLEAASQPFCALRLSQAQSDAIDALRESLVGSGTRQWSPIEIADREDAITEWLDEQGIDSIDPRLLAESAIAPEALQELPAVLGAGLQPVLAQVTMDYSVRHLAGEIETAASRIHALVAAVKGFTYMDQATVPKPVDLAQGIADTLTILKSKAKQKKVELGITLSPSLPRIEAFGGELNQVWSNLVSNAIDAVPEGGRVNVTAAVDGKNVTIKVTDNGPGIDPKVVPRIFEPFVTTKEVGQGTGLGLDMARRIVRRHHGTISFTTGPQGTEFTVTLPVAFPGLPN